MNTSPNELMRVEYAARHLRVPVRWLKSEAVQGRIPCLQADKAVLVHLDTVANILAERAKSKGTAQ